MDLPVWSAHQSTTPKARLFCLSSRIGHEAVHSFLLLQGRDYGEEWQESNASDFESQFELWFDVTTRLEWYRILFRSKKYRQGWGNQ